MPTASVVTAKVGNGQRRRGPLDKQHWGRPDSALHERRYPAVHGGAVLIPTFAVTTDAVGIVVNLYDAGTANPRFAGSYVPVGPQ